MNGIKKVDFMALDFFLTLIPVLGLCLIWFYRKQMNYWEMLGGTLFGILSFAIMIMEIIKLYAK